MDPGVVPLTSSYITAPRISLSVIDVGAMGWGGGGRGELDGVGSGGGEGRGDRSDPIDR